MRSRPLAEVPLTAIWALQDDTRIVIEGFEYAIDTNEILVLRGDICHQGASYAALHTRLHAYLDPLDFDMSPDLHGCD